MREQSESFGQAAELYDKVRPRYPEAALRWALGSTTEVVDLGAGTGILTRQLLDLGYRCVAVEPDAQMRQRCADQLADGRTRVLAGSAEAIPLPDGSADAVIAGQAYHWFDPATAHPEIARVLRQAGVFAPIWNIRDESVSWVAELTILLRSQDGAGVNAGWRGPPLDGHFTEVAQKTFPHAARHTPDSLRDLLRSRSYYLTASDAQRAELESDLRELLSRHPDLAGREEFDLPYVTVAYRARRR
ncbi:MAG: methyltransferase domain-containing protein [Micromonosporaceae bacterium]|nr:methyltransferase domain-containing protein [Micromonosporaceae bacterium]